MYIFDFADENITFIRSNGNLFKIKQKYMGGLVCLKTFHSPS